MTNFDILRVQRTRASVLASFSFLNYGKGNELNEGWGANRVPKLTSYFQRFDAQDFNILKIIFISGLFYNIDHGSPYNFLHSIVISWMKVHFVLWTLLVQKLCVCN